MARLLLLKPTLIGHGIARRSSSSYTHAHDYPAFTVAEGAAGPVEESRAVIVELRFAGKPAHPPRCRTHTYTIGRREKRRAKLMNGAGKHV